jgi:hypothetical protein
MSRSSSELRTTMGRDEAWRVICEYLGSQGFEQFDAGGETVWRKGKGLATVPQFIKAVPADGSVHLEAWIAAVSWVPGVYTGEQDLTGAWGFAIKAALKPRVKELETRLGGDVVSSTKIESPGPGASPAAAPSAPAAWNADPTARHQLRYWDGTRWTDDVADEGRTSQDPA